MKITAFFLFLGCLSVSAESYSQKTQVSLNLKNTSIRNIMELIENQTEYVFIFSDVIASDLDKKVNVKADSETLDHVLDEVFRSTALRYKINDRQVTVSKSETASQQKSERVIIKGTVRDKQGEVLIGVFVKCVSTGAMDITDANGQFSLTLPSAGEKISFSYIGYVTKEIVPDNLRNLDVTLEENTSLLEEVVVVVFGTQKKETISGSLSTLKGKELEIPTRSLINTLGGRVPGVFTIQSRGEPGNDDASFWIRGKGTWQGGRGALILVDGVPRTMSDIAPEEVETFTVLKDAAATSIYGAEGANGVVLITTKRGSDMKTRISYRGRYTVSQPTRVPNFLGAADFMNMYNEMVTNDGQQPYFSQEDIQRRIDKVDPDVYPDVDWWNEIINSNTSDNDHNLTFRGGGEKYSFFVSTSYWSQSGLYKNLHKENPITAFDNSTYYDRYNVRSNIDIKLTSTTKVSVNLAGQYSSKRAPSPGSDAIFATILEAPPYYFPARFSDGRFAAHPVEQKMNNPYNYALASGYHKYWTVRLQSDIALEQELSFITQGLKIRGQASFDNYSDWKIDRPYTVEQFVVNPANTTGGHLPDGSLDLAQFKSEVKFGTPETTTSNLSKRIYIEARLNYDRTFNETHSVSGMLTYFQKEQQDAGSGALPYRKQNLTGRAVYSYDRRYTAEVNFGYTGSENFAEGHRFGFFPAFRLPKIT